jgi:dienelactone hydrolase
MDQAMLNRELGSISGVYIPGDTKQSFTDEQYLTQVHRILEWSSKHNREDDKHFPIVGVSWGMLSLLKSQTTQDSLF